MNTIDELVSQDNELRLIDKHFDFSFIYEVTKPLYSHTGRPSIDPVNVFKIELINILGGYNSIRKTLRKIAVDVSYRWFLNLPFSEKVLDHSAISQLYKRKFEENEVYEQIFLNIMNQLREKGLINTKQIYIDRTHINKYLYSYIIGKLFYFFTRHRIDGKILSEIKLQDIVSIEKARFRLSKNAFNFKMKNGDNYLFLFDNRQEIYTKLLNLLPNIK